MRWPKNISGHRVETVFKEAISALLEQLEVLSVETILEYKRLIKLR